MASDCKKDVTDPDPYSKPDPKNPKPKSKPKSKTNRKYEA